MRRYLVIVVGLAAVPAGAATLANAATFCGLTDLPGGVFFSRATAVSGDGSAVVGYSASGDSVEAFRWTMAEGIHNLGRWAGPSHADAVNADGSFLAGTRYIETEPSPMVWWYDSGVAGDWSGRTPGGLNGRNAYGVSADGSVAVGVGTFNVYQTLGFRDSVGESLVKLYGKEGGWDALAYAVSPDGQVVVGTSRMGPGDQQWWEATKWEGDWSVGAMLGQGLGRLGTSESTAFAISADGSTIVGQSGQEAVRFTDGMISLGHLPGRYSSCAQAVSADGSIIVGWSESPREAFIWDDSHGMRNLKDVLETDYGLDLSGWVLSSAEGISDDGTVLAGYGTNPSGNTEGWVAIIPEPSTFIPEPSTFIIWALLGALAITVGWWRRRRAYC